MPLVNLEEQSPREIFTGCTGRFVHGATMTHAWISIKANSLIPEHSHPHEQIVNVLEGELELTVEGVPYRLTRGKVFVIPGGMPHSGLSITDCLVLDVFHPVREDFR